MLVGPLQWRHDLTLSHSPSLALSVQTTNALLFFVCLWVALGTAVRRGGSRAAAHAPAGHGEHERPGLPTAARQGAAPRQGREPQPKPLREPRTVRQEQVMRRWGAPHFFCLELMC